MNSVNNIQQAAEGGNHSIQISVSFDDFIYFFICVLIHILMRMYFEYQKSIISMRAIL